MTRKWMPTLLLVALLVAGGTWLYQAGALPFMGAHRAGQWMPTGGLPAALPGGPGPGGQNAAHPWQMLPQLLGDLWFIAAVITGVRLMQTVARPKVRKVSPRTARARATA